MDLLDIFSTLDKNNPLGIVFVFIKRLKVPVSLSTIKKTLEEHPDYPSMLSISDAFSGWKIGNTVIRVNREKVNELPVPFIAHTYENGGTLVLVESIGNGTVKCRNRLNRIVNLPLKDFLDKWTGITLFAEAAENSGEKEYARSIKKEKQEKLNMLAVPFLTIAMLLAVSLYWMCNIDPVSAGRYISLLLLKVSGVVVCTLLFGQELKIMGSLLDKVCSFKKKINCKAVMESKGARFLGLVRWSDIGFVYFAGGFLFSVFSYRPYVAFTYLAWVNLFALPFIVYSVVHQWKVVKQWCSLCLSILGILLLEAVVLNFTLQTGSLIFMPPLVINFAACFVFPAIFLFLVKPLLAKGVEDSKAKLELAKFKRNKDIFRALLSTERSVEVPLPDVGIVLGYPQATNTLIKVCNPFCGPCGKAHPYIEELLEERDDLKVQVIFSTSTDEDDLACKVAMHFMSLYKEGPTGAFKQALNEWYGAEQKDYERWGAKYSVNGSLMKQKEEIEKMVKWCEHAKIEHTPTFFVNCRELPLIYNAGELKYLV